MQSIKNILNASKYSISGLKFLWKERAFRQELFLFPFVLIEIYCIPHNRLYVMLSYFIILITEALNTAIESVVDRVSRDYHILSKKAKDIGSASVFIALLNFFIIIIINIIVHLT